MKTQFIPEHEFACNLGIPAAAPTGDIFLHFYSNYAPQQLTLLFTRSHENLQIGAVDSRRKNSPSNMPWMCVSRKFSTPAKEEVMYKDVFLVGKLWADEVLGRQK